MTLLGTGAVPNSGAFMIRHGNCFKLQQAVFPGYQMTGSLFKTVDYMKFSYKKQIN